MAFMDWVRCFADDVRAWRRGHVRVAPRPCRRGRVYKSREDLHAVPAGGCGAVMRAAGKPKGTLSARVWRDKEKRWEDLGVIAKFGEDKEKT